MLIFVILFGLVLGSFMGVLVYRIPIGMSIVMPFSHCGECKTPLKWYSNLPIISFILQKGKCRACGSAIPLIYVLTELVTALVFCLIFFKSGSTLITIKYCFFAFLLLAAAFTDVRTALDKQFDSGMIPDIYTIGGVVCGFIWTFVPLTGVSFYDSLAGSGAGYFIIMVPAFIYALIRKNEGIGDGDALLMAMAGSFLGAKAMLFVFTASAFIGLAVGIGVLLYTKDKYYKIPFAPSIAAASLLYIFVGDRVLWLY